MLVRVGMHVDDGKWHQTEEIRQSFPIPRPSTVDLRDFLDFLVEIRFLKRTQGMPRGGSYRRLSWPTLETLQSADTLAQRDKRISVRPGNVNEMRALAQAIPRLIGKAEGGIEDARDGLAMLSGWIPDEVGRTQQFILEMDELFARLAQALEVPSTKATLEEIGLPFRPYVEQIIDAMENEMPAHEFLSSMQAELQGQGPDLADVQRDFAQRIPHLLPIFAEIREALPRLAGLMSAESMYIDEYHRVRPGDPF